MNELDAVRLNFSPESLGALNLILAFVMFGVALDMKWESFAGIRSAPRAVVIGMLSQFLLLPASAWALTMLLRPSPSVALGVILVACCPGGNISNFLTHYARGNTALSVTMTAFSTVAALFFTPFNVAFWGALNPATRVLLREIAIDPVEMLLAVAVLLVVPALLGMGTARRFPGFAARTRKPFRLLSLGFFVAFVLLALGANWDYFLRYTARVATAVFLLNALGLLLGYVAAAAARLPAADRRAVSIETGIQNSGLGLILVFNFFGGLGGMAVTAAWWGIWHLLAGLALASWWRRRPPHPQREAAP
jgi:BASS family bile acid:Na+ symporter